MSWTRANRSACTVSIAAALATRAAVAQPVAGDAAMAETLFEDAKKLMASGDYAAACPKLAESNRLDPGSGTMTALALCHEQQGRTATAWAEFIEVVTEAQKAGRADREKFARQHIAALERTLSRLTITVAPDTARLPGLVVRRDQVAVGSAAWGVASPIDPGPHVVEATAPGHRPWSARVSVEAHSDSQAIEVPLLDPEAPPPPQSPAVDRGVPSDETVVVTNGSNAQSSRRTLGLVVGGAGVVVVGVGSYFGLQAISKSNEAKRLCSPTSCTDPGAVQTNDDAKTDAHVADVAMGVGLVAAGVGLYLYLTGAPARSGAARVRVTPLASRDGGGAAVEGRW